MSFTGDGKLPKYYIKDSVVHIDRLYFICTRFNVDKEKAQRLSFEINGVEVYRHRLIRSDFKKFNLIKLGKKRAIEVVFYK